MADGSPAFALRGLAALVLFGSSAVLGQTFWTPRAHPGSPPQGRFGHGMSYDAARARTVVFGGNDGDAARADTWEWDGTTWSPRPSATSPSARYECSMTHDAARQRSVLFGGRGGDPEVLRTDTWEWDGTDWTLRSGASPPARLGAAFAFDAARGRCLLFGGTNRMVRLGDTWEWDGSQWTQRFPASAPSARSHAAMAFDAARGRVVLYGGDAGAYPGDTWEWDGTNWQQRSPTAPPLQPTARHGMVYDFHRGRTVLFGGDERGAVTSTTHEWDGTTWRLRASDSPSARQDVGLVYDAARGRVVLFGGQGSSTRFSDTWEYCSYCDVVGRGHPPGGAPLLCRTPPQLGTSFCLVFPSATNSGFIGVGLAPPIFPPILINVPGLCSPVLVHTIPFLTIPAGGGPAVGCIPLPAEPALLGWSFCLQAFALQVSCYLSTDAVVVRIQS